VGDGEELGERRALDQIHDEEELTVLLLDVELRRPRSRGGRGREPRLGDHDLPEPLVLEKVLMRALDGDEAAEGPWAPAEDGRRRRCQIPPEAILTSSS